MSAKSIKIFCFTVPGFLTLLLPDGTLLNKIAMDNEDDPKEILQGEGLNQSLAERLKTTNFSTLWIADPAGDPEVVKACRIMQERENNPDTVDTGEFSEDPELLALNGETGEAAVLRPLPEPNSDGIYSLHSIGLHFLLVGDEGGENVAINVGELQIGEICAVDGLDGVSVTDQFEVVATAINSGEEGSGDFIIQVKKVVVEVTPPEPKFQQSAKTKVIEVECPETYSEQEMKRLTRALQSLKIAACASAAEYRDQIKEAEKALFAAANGKSLTSMECRVENDWEAGIRRFIRPDTGDVAKTEQIPWEERQFNLNLPEAEVAEPQTVESLTKELGEICDEVGAMIPRDENGDVVDGEVELLDTDAADGTGHALDEFADENGTVDPQDLADAVAGDEDFPELPEERDAKATDNEPF